jgi:transposase
MLNPPFTMYHRFARTPTDEEHTELHRITQQEVGRVAERARMILLSARGFTVQRIMQVFEVVDETLYKWLDRFDEQGPEGLFDRDRSGRPPEIDEEAQSELERLLERSPLDEGYSFTTWTTPLIKSHLSEHMGIEVSEDTVRRTVWSSSGGVPAGGLTTKIRAMRNVWRLLSRL